MKKLPVNGAHFRISPKFLHSNLCFLILKDTAPTAVLNNILEEFRKWKADSDGTITVDGKVFEPVVRRPVPPGRLRRNAILNQAVQFVKAHATSLTKDLGICWQTGALKHGTEVIFSCEYEAGKAYFEPLLALGITKEQLSSPVDRPAPPQGKRL